MSRSPDAGATASTTPAWNARIEDGDYARRGAGDACAEASMGATTYVSVSRLRVDPAAVDDLIAAFRDRLGLVDAFPGFLDLEVWQSDREPGEILMVSHWAQRADFTAYMKSAEHRASHDRIPARIQDAIRLERLEHIVGYEVIAR